MALDPVKNFAIVTVSTGYDASATSIALTSGHGAKLPAPGTDGAFNLVWWNSTDYSDPSDDPNVEIVRVTARSTDTLTVTRAQEGTSASTKNTASKTYKMMLAPTKKFRDDINTALPPNTTYDTNGNELLEYEQVASAVNNLKIINAATGNPAILAAFGGDSTVKLRLRPKGDKSVEIYPDGGGTPKLELYNTYGSFLQMVLSGGGLAGQASQPVAIQAYTENVTFSEYTSSHVYYVIFDTLGVKVKGRFALVPQSPAQITANQNNYALPTYKSGMLRLSSDAARDITGIAAGTGGQTHVVWNVGSNNIVLKHQDTNSTTSNRFICSTGADITLAANKSVLIQYDDTDSRWRVTLLP